MHGGVAQHHAHAHADHGRHGADLPGVSEMISDWSLSARTVMLLAATSLPSMVTRE